ncbi:MAG: nucleoside-diphosphate kinase [Bryobacteraceae bacterium]
MERTLAIIKPDSVARGIAGEILSTIEQAGFRVRGLRMLQLDRQQAEGFYAVHRGKPFFPDLVEFMTEGPIVVLALEREDAIRKWREAMGATNPAHAAEGTIRKRFGTSIQHNCVHGSDAPDTAQFELGYFFSEVELV